MSESMQEIERALKSMNSAITHLRFYGDDHPIGRQSSEASYRELSNLLAGRDETTLLLIEDQFVWNDRPLSAPGQPYSRLMKDLEERGIESITFCRKLGHEEFIGFLKDMAHRQNESVSSRGNIKFGKLVLKSHTAAAPLLTHPDQEALGTFEDIRDKKFADLQDIYSQIVRMKKINIKGVDDVISAFIKGFAYGVNPIRLLFQIRNVDEYTYTHMVNVCILTMSQAESLGFEGRHLYQIGVAAILHDAGKLLIPQGILNKPGKLTPNERSVIETHSAKGASFILSQKSVTKLAVVGALEHHIRYDGTGYPVISSGYKTNIVSQMISISDVFDAMRSRRPYKEPKPIDAILHILTEEKGATFNPILVDNFIRLLATKPH